MCVCAVYLITSDLCSNKTAGYIWELVTRLCSACLLPSGMSGSALSRGCCTGLQLLNHRMTAHQSCLHPRGSTSSGTEMLPFTAHGRLMLPVLLPERACVQACMQ